MKKIKIVRLTVQYYHQQEQKMLAADRGNGVYLTEHGNICPEKVILNVSGTRNIPDPVKDVFRDMADLYIEKCQTEEKIRDLQIKLGKFSEKENELQKKLRNAMGLMTRSEFEEEFFKNLPLKIREQMEAYGFEVKHPTGIGYTDSDLCISRNVLIKKYSQNVSFVYQEYDGNYFLIDSPEKNRDYQYLLKRYSVNIGFKKVKLEECLFLGDKISVNYPPLRA